MKDQINRIFDIVKLIAERLPILNNLIVEIAVIGLLIYGLIAIFGDIRH